MAELPTDSCTTETEKKDDPDSTESQEHANLESPQCSNIETHNESECPPNVVSDKPAKDAEIVSLPKESSQPEVLPLAEETNAAENNQLGESEIATAAAAAGDGLETKDVGHSEDEKQTKEDIKLTDETHSTVDLQTDQSPSQPETDDEKTEDHSVTEDKTLVGQETAPVEDHTQCRDNIETIDGASPNKACEIELEALLAEFEGHLGDGVDLEQGENAEVIKTIVVESKEGNSEVVEPSSFSDELKSEKDKQGDDEIQIHNKPELKEEPDSEKSASEENKGVDDKSNPTFQDDVNPKGGETSEKKKDIVPDILEKEKDALPDVSEKEKETDPDVSEKEKDTVPDVSEKEKDAVPDVVEKERETAPDATGKEKDTVPDVSVVGICSPQTSPPSDTHGLETDVNKTDLNSEEEGELLDKSGELAGIHVEEQESTEEEDGGIEEDEEEEEEEEEEESDDALESEQDGASDREDGELSGDEDYRGSQKEDDGSPRDGDGASYVNEKRIMGDGEEEPEVKAEKRLDDDEDKANPAYIPRKGAFYEHDLRLDADDEVDQETDQEKLALRPNKKLWVDQNKWQHDRYDARLQAPKSTQELVDSYGYDIRKGKESDVPVRNVRSRGRRPGQNNRFGDYLPRRTETRHDDEERFYRTDQPSQDQHRYRIRNENRSQHGGSDHHRNMLNDSQHSEFPPLQETASSTRSVQQTSENKVYPTAVVVRSEPAVGASTNSRGQDNKIIDGNSAAHNRTEERTPRDFRKDDDGEARHTERKRGGLSRGGRLPASRARGRGHRRWQQELHEPGGVFVRNDEFYEPNDDGERAPQSYGRSNRHSENPRQRGHPEYHREFESSYTNSSVAEDSFRRHHADNGRERVPNRDNNRPSESEHEHNNYRDNEYSEHARNQGQRLRGQRPLLGGDYGDRRNRQIPEAFATRTIQNSNISARQMPNSRTREMEKQDLLNSVSAAMKNMALDDRSSAGKTQGNVAVRTDRPTERYEQHGGNNTFRMHGAERSRRDELAESAVQEDRRGEINVENSRKKMSVVIQTTDAPEMIPPVTVVSTYPKSQDRVAIAPRLAASDRTQNKGWAGGEFTPAWRLQATAANNVENAAAATTGKPKRYSTQRQKATGAEAPYAETSNADYHETIEVAGQGLVQQPLTAALPSRPLPAATYYDSNSSYAAPAFHPAQGMSLGMHGMPYQMPANLQHGMYNAQPQIAKPGNPIHNVYLPPPGSMLPNPFLTMPSLMNYPSQFQLTPVQLQPGAPNAHLHHGPLQDQEQVDMHRVMYFNQQGITVPMMHPQYIDQSGYIDETNAVDPSIASQGYIETRDMTSPTHAQEY